MAIDAIRPEQKKYHINIQPKIGFSCYILLLIIHICYIYIRVLYIHILKGPKTRRRHEIASTKPNPPSCLRFINPSQCYFSWNVFTLAVLLFFPCQACMCVLKYNGTPNRKNAPIKENEEHIICTCFVHKNYILSITCTLYM